MGIPDLTWGTEIGLRGVNASSVVQCTCYSEESTGTSETNFGAFREHLRSAVS